MSEEIANLINSALAALTQNATFPADVEFAKNRLREAQSLLTKHALDAAKTCRNCHGLVGVRSCNCDSALPESPRQ